MDAALVSAVYDGLKVSGVTFITAVLAGQLTKAGLNSMLVHASESMVKALGTKGYTALANALQNGGNLYGISMARRQRKARQSCFGEI